MKNLYFLIILVSLTLFACNKVDNDIGIKNYFAVAGETDSITYRTVNLNDTITLESIRDINYSVLIKHGMVYKINFDLHHTWRFGGTIHNYWSTLEVRSPMELLVDTSMKTHDVYHYKQYPKKEITYVDSSQYLLKDTIPKWIDKGALIDKQVLWLTNFSCKLASYDEWIPNISDTLVTYGHTSYKGWLGLKNKYVGFRLVSPKDTIYGWLSMEVAGYNKIILSSYSYRRD
jgi:hypothetical protein